MSLPLHLTTLAAVVAAAIAATTCPSSWTQNGTYCYRVIETEQIYKKGRGACRKLSLHADLASVLSREEHAHVASIIPQRVKRYRTINGFRDVLSSIRVYIGLRRRNGNSTVFWTDGSLVSYHWFLMQNGTTRMCYVLWGQKLYPFEYNNCTPRLKAVCKVALSKV